MTLTTSATALTVELSEANCSSDIHYLLQRVLFCRDCECATDHARIARSSRYDLAKSRELRRSNPRNRSGRRPSDQGSTSASSTRLPNGSAKKASLRLMAGKTKGSVTILTPRARSLASVSSTLATLRQKWW